MDQETLTRLNTTLLEKRLKFALGRRLGIHRINLYRKLRGDQGINPQQLATIEAFCAEEGIRL
jgi:hypothetical protein